MAGSSKGWLKNFVLLVSSVCVALLLGEVVVATVSPQSLGTWSMTRDGLTTHVPHVSIYHDQFRRQITINSHGMRDREHDLRKPPGTFRILVLGDSFMEANQVPFEESFPALLEARLGRPVEVINCSVSGWGTDDELTYLMRYGFQFQPDVVLLAMTLHNDLQDNLAEEFHSFADGILEEIAKHDMPSWDYSILQVKEFLASHSHLYQLVLRSKRFSWMQQEGNRLSSHVASLLVKEPSEEVRRGWDMTRQLLRKMKRETEKQGATLVMFTIPLWVQVSDERLRHFLEEHKMSAGEVMLDLPQRTLRTIGQEEDVEVIDLLDEFRQVGQQGPMNLYLAQDGHWTASGHRLAAVLVGERLRERISTQSAKRVEP